MTLKTLHQLIGHGDKDKRVENDFYATPTFATEELLKRETFDGKIWEPACGDGAISKLLINKGYEVYSTDLIDRGYGDDHFDFMKTLEPCENIITNPPFNIGTKFTIHALNCATKKVAIFNKLSFLEGKERRDNLFCRRNLHTVYVFSERVSFSPGNSQNKGGMLAFAWYVFDKTYYGNPAIEWI